MAQATTNDYSSDGRSYEVELGAGVGCDDADSDQPGVGGAGGTVVGAVAVSGLDDGAGDVVGASADADVGYDDRVVDAEGAADEGAASTDVVHLGVVRGGPRLELHRARLLSLFGFLAELEAY